MTISKKNNYAINASIFILASTCLLILFVPSTSLAQEQKSAQLVPLNPEFVRYNQNIRTYGIQNMTAGGHALGYIPSPINVSHISTLPARSLASVAIVAAPQSYDLRTSGKLTAVRDQGQCGSCWTFGTMSSLESYLLPAETWDFSENNLKNTSGFDMGHCYGGNAFMSTAYLSRWSGPVKEVDDPYSVYSSLSPTGLPARKHIQEVFFIPERTNSTDNDTIKQIIMTYGAIYTTMYMNESTPYYNATTSSYYYNGSAYSNHAVAIVGWDDNYSSSNFSITPSANGAFIIRNSWGAAWGVGGYFYISYYDTNVGKSNAIFIGAQPTTNYARIYQYDPLGATSTLGYSSNTAWFANIFTAEASERLAAVSFYTVASNSTYTMMIYTNTSSLPNSGTLAESISGTIAFAGYHTITLPNSIPLTSGKKFSIVAQLTTPGYNFPITIESPVPGYSGRAVAGGGQSYISSSGTLWTDLTNNYANSNVCLKAFTTNTTNIPSPPILKSIQ